MQNYNLPDCQTTTTFEGVQFVLPTDDLWNLAYATAKIQVRQSPDSPVLLEFRPGDASLLIEQPHTITVPSRIINLRPGTYVWDLKIRFADQRVKTLIGGKWTIKPTVTKI